MRLQIEDKSYELTDECISGLLADLKRVLFLANAKLPPDIRVAIEGVTSLSDDSLLQLVCTLKDFGLGYYLNMSGPKRFGAMGVARWLITQAEKKLGEAAQVLRPPKRADPVEHIASVVYPMVEKSIPKVGEVLPNVTIKANTKGSNVTSIEFGYAASSQGG